jgi:hypothetical protein
MTRGIHLKHLTATDLGLLGLPDDLLQGGATDAAAVSADSAPALAGEVDPVLTSLTREVREALEEALFLLDQALELGQPL